MLSRFILTFLTSANDKNYPADWEKPEVRDKYMFNTYEDCCQSFFNYVNCQKIDACYVPPTSSPTSCAKNAKWHPTTNFKMCTNSFEYPPSWKIVPMSDLYMHDSLESCCQKFFSGSTCPYEDVCPTSTPTTSPTNPVPTTPPTTSPPTKRPTTSPTFTFSPTDCLSGYKWHHKGSTSKTCSNDLNYPLAWDNPSVTHNYLFDTPAECCEKFFSTVECTVTDACGDMSTVIYPQENVLPTLEPTEMPSTHYPTAEQTETNNGYVDGSCSGNKWHPISSTNRKCTNGINDYPSTWNSPPLSDKFLLNSAEECCQSFYDGDCEIIDMCSSQAPATTSPEDSNTRCNGRKYHPISSTNRKCTNDDNYPPLWNAPSISYKFLFTSAEECCSSFYSDGGCDIVNVCSTDSQPSTSTSTDNCDGRRWHPKTFIDRTCSNSDEYPPLWNKAPMSNKFLLGTAEECCSAFYSTGECQIVNVC